MAPGSVKTTETETCSNGSPRIFRPHYPPVSCRLYCLITLCPNTAGAPLSSAESKHCWRPSRPDLHPRDFVLVQYKFASLFLLALQKISVVMSLRYSLVFILLTSSLIYLSSGVVVERGKGVPSGYNCNPGQAGLYCVHHFPNPYFVSPTISQPSKTSWNNRAGFLEVLK